MMELLIAVAVIMVGVIGTITLALTSVRLAREGRIRVVAANLGREGIEIVRMSRDSNWLGGVPWQTGLPSADDNHSLIPEFVPTSGWTLNFNPASIDEDAAKVIRVGATYLQHEGFSGVSSDTIYRRLVNIHPICEASPAGGCSGEGGVICHEGESCGVETQIGVQVISTVRSTYRGIVRDLTLEERLYDWR